MAAPYRRIVCVTDCVDIAASELRASLLHELGERADEVALEPIAPVYPPFSAINTSFALRLMAEAYGPQTLFLVTVSFQQQQPASLLGRCKELDVLFIGRNTGAFDWITRDYGCAELVNLGRNYKGTGVDYQPFTGKVVTGPLAVRAALGAPLASLGDPVPESHISRLSLEPFTIVHIDNFGVMKLTGDIAALQEGERVKVTLRQATFEAVVGHRIMSFPDGTWVLYPGSSFGLPELGIPRSLAAPTIGAAVGDVLTIEPIPGVTVGTESRIALNSRR